MFKNYVLPGSVIAAGLTLFLSYAFFFAPRCTAESQPGLYLGGVVKIAGC